MCLPSVYQTLVTWHYLNCVWWDRKPMKRTVGLHDITAQSTVFPSTFSFTFLCVFCQSDRPLGSCEQCWDRLLAGLLEWCTRQDYEKTLQINLIGVIDVTITFLPLLKKARGRVVNIASALSRVAVGTGGYAESKYGVQAFSDTLRLGQ